MKHFSDERWLDFARRLLAEDEAREMRAHLEAGCDKCAEVLALWQTVNQIVIHEADFLPDDSIVSAVKVAYENRPWERVAPPPRLQFASLVFDSFLTAGVLAGTRSISPAARHLLYRVGTLAIDVRLDTFSGGLMTIAGQIVGRATDAAFAHREVAVVRGEDTIGRTSTNQFGEFLIEVDRGPDVRVRVEVDASETVVLPLPD